MSKKKTGMAEELAGSDDINRAPDGGRTSFIQASSPVDKGKLVGDGRFYPAGATVSFRAAGVQEIRKWASMDENNPKEVYDGIIDIIKSCVRGIHWKDLKEADRFKMLLYIHDATFMEAEHKMQIKCTCGSCRAEYNAEVLPDHLSYKNLPDKIMEKVDPVTGRLVFDTRSFGEIEISIPSLGAIEIVTDYAARQNIKWITENKAFLDIAPYLILDWKTAGKKTMDDLNAEYNSWGVKKLGAMLELQGRMATAMNKDASSKCGQCGHINKVDVNKGFEKGVRRFFVPGVSNFDTEFL